MPEAEIGRLVLGTYAFGGWYWGPANDLESTRLIHRALDMGISSFDTAPIYGFGHAEELLGKALKGTDRSRVFIATKVGLVWDETQSGRRFFVTRHGQSQYVVRRRLSPDSIRRGCEESLQRLKTDYVDLLQLHWPDDDEKPERTAEALLRLIEENKIRYIGVCNYTVEQMLRMNACIGGRLYSDQERYNLISRRARLGNIPYTRKNRIRFLAYSPLAQGLLTDKIWTERNFPSGDLRAEQANMSPEWWERLRKAWKAIQDAGLDERPVAAITLAYLLGDEGVSSVIFGVRSEKQLCDNLRALDRPLTAELRHLIRNTFEPLEYNGK